MAFFWYIVQFLFCRVELHIAELEDEVERGFFLALYTDMTQRFMTFKNKKKQGKKVNEKTKKENDLRKRTHLRI